MTNNHVIFSWADRSRTPFSNMFYALLLISHIIWPVKRDHLTEYILVLVYCLSHNNNQLGTFRIIFFYASKFYYPNHAFDNSRRITIHECFIKLNMHRNNKVIKQCLIIYISNIKSGYNILGLGLALTIDNNNNNNNKKERSDSIFSFDMLFSLHLLSTYYFCYA